MRTTFGEILDRHRVEIPPHLEAQAEVPVLSGPQRQGDLIIVPTRPGADLGDQVPAGGVPVVRGEAGGNTHLLVGDGPITWRPAGARDQTLGVATVPAGSIGYLLHPEHGAQAFAPGSYLVRRQREQADEIRTLAD